MGAPEARRPPTSSRGGFVSALVFVVAFDVLVLVHFHDHSWWPPDEGVYAHTAERMLQGEVLNKDLEEIHTGYIHFFHVAAFDAFGIELLSLRYPLIAAGLLQSLLLFLLFARHDAFLAVVAATSAIAMGVIQFLNPQPSWYCLLFATLAACCLALLPSERSWRLILAGFAVGMVYYLRQISGIFVAMAVVTYLLTEDREEGAASDLLLARVLLTTMLIGTVVYLLSATNLSGLPSIGIWPVALLALAALTVETTNRTAAGIVAKLAAGFVAASLPILAYHIAHGSLAFFFDDTIVRAFRIQQLGYLKSASFADQQAYAIRNILALGSFDTVVNGIYWLLLPFGMLVTGAVALLRLSRCRSSRDVGFLPVLALFYAQVALFQQIPIYLFYVLPLTAAGLLWLCVGSPRRLFWPIALLAIFFTAVSLHYHAGQPVTRGLSGTIRGERTPLVPSTPLDRVGLRIDQRSLDTYRELVDTIRTHSQPADAIFALPYNPELYFLAQRRNPFRFWNTAVGVRSAADLERVLDRLATDPPQVIVVAPADRNNTPASREIIAHVREKYALTRTISGFEVYRAP